MKAKLVNESIHNKGVLNTVETTVDELFTWYMGDEDWDKDWQTTNSMFFDDVHAQDDGNRGRSILAFLRNRKNEKIMVVTIDRGDPNTYDIEFKLGKHQISFDSINVALETPDDDY